jgi:hypothetical protein
MSHTGENENGLQKILDLTRWGSLFILLLHGYYSYAGTFRTWGYTHAVSDRLLQQVAATGLFDAPLYSKGLSLGLLCISLLGVRGRKKEGVRVGPLLLQFLSGALVFVFTPPSLFLSLDGTTAIFYYGAVTGTTYLLVLGSGTALTRHIRGGLSPDVFNEANECFPQEERLLDNPYSINLKAAYTFRGVTRTSWINIINPFRGLLILGSPGSGKSYFIIEEVIRQHIQKGFALFVYDFKYDDLTRLAYYWYLRYRKQDPLPPAFYIINFDDLSRSHRCNPLDPATLHDITDATESARTILLGLNRDWISKQGDFFVESPINFLTAVIWFLKKSEGGQYCTLPHVIELMQSDYTDLFPVLNTEPEIEVLINPFISAYQHDAMDQLEGQVASAKIGMARLSSPQLYWVLSGHDFTLDINNPQAPKIVCMGNNPGKQQVYGAVLSLYISRLTKLVNQKGGQKCSLVFDEFPTIFFNGMDALIATARSNKVATTMAVQDFSQLKKDYGRDRADVLMNITGNVISGQVNGETARQLSERFGKILQDRASLSINRTDTSITRSKQLEAAIPPSRIAGLSAGEFVGMVADNPGERIRLKTFHAIVEKREAKKGQGKAVTIPVRSQVSIEQVMENYYQVRLDIKALVRRKLESIKKKVPPQ